MFGLRGRYVIEGQEEVIIQEPIDIEPLTIQIQELVEIMLEEKEVQEEEALLNEEMLIQQEEEELLLLEEEELLKQQKEEQEQEFRGQVLEFLSAENPIPNDYTETLVAINDNLIAIQNQNEILIDQVKDVPLSSSVLSMYGIIYIPFVIVVFLLWRFFATFLRSFR